VRRLLIQRPLTARKVSHKNPSNAPWRQSNLRTKKAILRDRDFLRDSRRFGVDYSQQERSYEQIAAGFTPMA